MVEEGFSLLYTVWAVCGDYDYCIRLAVNPQGWIPGGAEPMSIDESVCYGYLQYDNKAVNIKWTYITKLHISRQSDTPHSSVITLVEVVYDSKTTNN